MARDKKQTALPDLPSGDKLTREDIAAALAGELGSHKDAKEFTNGFFDALAEVSADNPKLKISRFGSFVCTEKKARMGRNPRTGKSAEISARRVVKFVPSQNFRNKTLGNDAG